MRQYHKDNSMKASHFLMACKRTASSYKDCSKELLLMVQSLTQLGYVDDWRKYMFSDECSAE